MHKDYKDNQVKIAGTLLLSELADQIFYEISEDATFEFIVELDRRRASFEFTEQLYNFFKEEYEKELDLSDD